MVPFVSDQVKSSTWRSTQDPTICGSLPPNASIAVSFISRSADPTTRTFLVETTVSNDGYEIREGSTADIYISLAGAKGHLLPQSSLTLNSSGELGVRVAINNKAKFIPVKIIRDAEEGIWVTGLPNSAEVIVVGQEYVTVNSNIKVSYKVSE